MRPTIEPMHDRVLVQYLDDPEHLDSRVIALIKNENTLNSQAGNDPIGEMGDYRRVMRRAKVVAVGPGKRNDEPVEVKPGYVIFCSAWDDVDGMFPGYALIREADIALIEQ